MKRAIFVAVSCFVCYMTWWHNMFVYHVIYKFQNVVPMVIVQTFVRLTPMVLCVVMGIMLRRVIYWPFKRLRLRAEERETSKALAERYQSTKRTMDGTRRRV